MPTVTDRLMKLFREYDAPVKFKRYPDGCYAVVKGNRRGPCAHSRLTALQRYIRSGFISFVGTGH